MDPNYFSIVKTFQKLGESLEKMSNSKQQIKMLNLQHNFDIHKEINWRNVLYQFETQRTFTIMDLIILNSLINPYEHGDALDIYVNSVIVNTLDEHHISINTYDDDKRYKAIKKVALQKYHLSKDYKFKKTLFDYEIPENRLDEPLTFKQSAKVRECAHLLLKNDWKKQVK